MQQSNLTLGQRLHLDLCLTLEAHLKESTFSLRTAHRRVIYRLEGVKHNDYACEHEDRSIFCYLLLS